MQEKPATFSSSIAQPYIFKHLLDLFLAQFGLTSFAIISDLVLKMAAIIAQLAAANRKRKMRVKTTLPPDKSNRVLPPFDPCFDPNKHNRYLRLKAITEHRQIIMSKAKGLKLQAKS